MALPTRVAYLHEFSTLNGGERSFLNLLNQLDPSRVFPIVLCPAGDLAKRVCSQGVHWINFALRRDGKRQSLQGATEQLATILAEQSVQIIHGNSLSTAEYTGLLTEISDHSTLISISHIRDIQKLKKNRVKRLNQNHALVPVSQATADHLVEQGVEASKLHVVWNGISKKFPANNTRRQALWPGDDVLRPLIVNIGQICLRKAQDLCLKAAIPILLKYPEWQLAFVGERFSQKQESLEYERDLMATVQSADLDSQVHFLGYRYDVPKILARSQFLVHSAHQEPLGRVLIEAQVAGLPVVCSDVGGSREIILSSHTGLIVPAADPGALAYAMEQLILDPELRIRWGLAAQKRALTKFDERVSANRIMDLYDHLLDSMHST